MEPEFTEEQMDRMIAAWHRHTQAMTALVMNLTTLLHDAEVKYDAETVAVIENNLEALRLSAEPLDGGASYTEFITELTGAMAEVFVADDKPNRNLI